MTVSAIEARNKLGELLSRVSLNSEEITIERAGKKVAKLVSSDAQNTSSQNSGLLLFSSARGLGASIWQDTNVAEYVAEEREEWG